MPVTAAGPLRLWLYFQQEAFLARRMECDWRWIQERSGFSAPFRTKIGAKAIAALAQHLISIRRTRPRIRGQHSMAISAQGFERFGQNLALALIAQDHFFEQLQIVLGCFIVTLLSLLDRKSVVKG